jgi:hypothetical protein
VDWFVDKNHHDSDVVTRELQHLEDLHNFSANYALSLSGNVSPSAFPSKVDAASEESQKHYDGTRAQKMTVGSSLDKPHNLARYPKQDAVLPEFEDTASKAPYPPPPPEPAQ